MIRKINKVLLFLLILPICISFSACKKDKNNQDNSNQNQVEQPKPDDGDSGDDYESNKDTYAVSFDYNLPEEYDFLLASKDFTIKHKQVGTNTSLANVPDLKLQKHFIGWCEEGSDVVLEGSVTSDVSKTIKLKGKWDETSLKKYYYSDGLSLDVIAGQASVFAYNGTGGTIIIPEVFTVNSVDYEVAEIQANVFAGKNVQKLIINTDNLNIGKEAFKNSSISECDFSRVRSIGESAFENTAFVNLKLDDSVSQISKSVFKNCKSLKSIDFDNNNINISQYMFYGCENLENITNTANLTEIDSYAFAECWSLENTDFLGPRVKEIFNFAFQNCKGLVSVTLPETLNFVYESVFDGCDAITELRLGQTFEVSDNSTRYDKLLNHIGDLGDNITQITLIGNSIKQLSRNYFDGLTSLESFVMVDSVETVESYTFRQCVNLKNITLSNNLDTSEFTYMAFYGTKFLNEMIEPLIYKNEIMYVPANITPEYAFPQGVNITRINDGAFAGNSSLKKITIPASVESMGVGVFKDCINLETVVFEENNLITEINTNTFYGCKKLTSVNLNNLTGLIKLKDNSFRGTAIANFVIPSTVSEIGNSVFLYSEIQSFEIDGISDKFVVQDGVLYEINNQQKILLNYPVYKDDEIFICPNDVVSVAPYAFSNVIYLNYIYFKHDVEWITVNISGDERFYCFMGSTDLTIFAENHYFDTIEIHALYRLCTSGVTYDFETNTLTLDENFETYSEFVYVKRINPLTNKVNLICFMVEEDGEGASKTYTIVENSIFTLEADV